MDLHSEFFWLNLLEKVHKANFVKKNAELKPLIKNDLKQTLQCKFPNTPLEVRLFGSRIMGVGCSKSDLDVFVVIGNSSGIYNGELTWEVLSNLRNIANAIKDNRTKWKLTYVKDRRFPLVTVLHKRTNIKCDINFLNSMSYDQNQLVNYIFKLQPIARYMVIYLKAWSRNHNLNMSFRGHILILLVIFFLQNRGQLPAIKYLQTGMTPNVAPWTSNFHKFPLSKFRMKKITVNENSTRQFLEEFFEFYSTFRFVDLVVCPYLGESVNRKELKNLMPPCFKHPGISPAFIQDLILLDHNKGCSIRRNKLRAFQHECCVQIDNLNSTA